MTGGLDFDEGSAENTAFLTGAVLDFRVIESKIIETRYESTFFRLIASCESDFVRITTISSKKLSPLAINIRFRLLSNSFETLSLKVTVSACSLVPR